MGHLAAARKIVIRQSDASAAMTENLPEPLTGDGEIGPSHKGGHVLEGVSQKNPDLMRDTVFPDAGFQVFQDAGQASRIVIADLSQKG